MHESTHYGLNNWSRAMFEKLGWMLLGYTKGFPNELKHYIECVKDLHTSIKEKMNTVHDEDTKADLKILKENVESLLFFSKLMLKTLDEHYAENKGNSRMANMKKTMKKPMKKTINKPMKKSMNSDMNENM